MRKVPLLLVGLLLISSCSESEPQGDGLLAVLDDDNVVVMDRSGGNRVAITTAATGEGAAYFQPVWSPGGDRLAFSRLSPGTGLHVAAANSSEFWAVDTDTLPFYFAWSAAGEVALLRNGDPGALVLEVTSLDEDTLATPRMLDSGAPLYFSWSPDGSSMTTHVGADRLETNNLSSAQPLGPQPGAFQAPWWTDRGIFAIEGGPSDQAVALIDADGTSRPFARVLGPTNLVATPDGDRVAVQTNVTERDGVSAAYRQLPSIPPNRVVVIDAETGEQTNATNGPALAFFWSPQGDRLLILDIDDRAEARWSIWDDGDLQPVVSFELEPAFLRNVLPFFDQYAQSMSLWSPDGTTFAFPGTIDGESGIWVKSDHADAQRISGGTWVAWSG